MSDQVDNNVLSYKIDNLAQQLKAHAEKTTLDRDELKKSIDTLHESFEGTPGVPGIKTRVDRMEQAFIRSQKISSWVLGVIGSVIAAQGITIINLILARIQP